MRYRLAGKRRSIERLSAKAVTVADAKIFNLSRRSYIEGFSFGTGSVGIALSATNASKAVCSRVAVVGVAGVAVWSGMMGPS